MSHLSPRLAALLRRRARIVRLHARCDELIAEELGRCAILPHPDALVPGMSPVASSRPVADPGTMIVYWRGLRCDLGPGILFRLAAKLFRNTHRWVDYSTLQDEVWRDALASDGTIKVGMSRLRGELTDAGMADLATALVLKKQHCGYFPNGQPD